MTRKETKKIAERLLKQRRAILAAASKTLSEEAALAPDELPDELDQACAGYDQSMVFRLRDRESRYLAKIEEALGRIEAGTFGTCEGCGDPINLARLTARPVTTLCIRCKEAQEIEERRYA